MVQIGEDNDVVYSRGSELQQGQYVRYGIVEAQVRNTLVHQNSIVCQYIHDEMEKQSLYIEEPD